MRNVSDNSVLFALVVDDEEDARDNMTYILQKEGIKVVTASDGYQALEKLQSLKPAPKVVLLDVSMPGIDGIEVLKRIRLVDDNLPVILITGHSNIRQSVEAMRDGAYDYIVKPFDNAEITRITLRALSEGQLRSYKLKEGESGALSLFESMGPSNAIARLTAEVLRVAKSNYSVLLIGETGTGKELVASAIHENSLKHGNPFIIVDCGAIPETLLESELFGYERGSFTGADRQKLGKFELANGGTLLLDEVANLPLASQAKLLRALQSRVINRIGGTKPIEVDFRLIAATNRSLREMVVSGTFREDLYYRLCDFTINLPALRERKEDILFLANRFLSITEAELNKKTQGFSKSAIDELVLYTWPGNVRELKSVIRRAALDATGAITDKDLGIGSHMILVSNMIQKEMGYSWKGVSLRDLVQRSVVEVERTIIQEVLQVTNGNKAKAARLLQIDNKTMYAKLRKLGIQLLGDEYE
jgi:DNA-binding NtrC family response regulator